VSSSSSPIYMDDCRCPRCAAQIENYELTWTWVERDEGGFVIGGDAIHPNECKECGAELVVRLTRHHFWTFIMRTEADKRYLAGRY